MPVRARYFVAAFCAALIFVGAMCGFILVDSSTERYMPGLFSPMMEAQVDQAGLTVGFLGYRLHLPARPVLQAAQMLHRFRGLVPARTLLTGQGILALWSEGLQMARAPARMPDE